MLAVDHFTEINVTRGYPAGARVLRALGVTLLAQLRDRGDLAGRYGEEEFAILLPDTNANEAKKFCQRVREVFAAIAFEANGWRFHATFSAGIATDESADIFDAAIRALYAAQQVGTNQEVLLGGT